MTAAMLIKTLRLVAKKLNVKPEDIDVFAYPCKKPIVTVYSVKRNKKVGVEVA